MKIRQNKQSGFTAIELLITLFVAAGFLIASYQLFNLVIRDAGATRAESRASNVAYDYLRRYSNSATNPCTTLTPVNAASITVDGLSNVSITVAITCPGSYTTTAISKVTATITYNSPAKTVVYSTLVNGVSFSDPNDKNNIAAKTNDHQLSFFSTFATLTGRGK